MTETRETDTPRRVADRPSPSQWGCTELMTLTEAVALYWPHGPLTVKSLRTAIRNGELPVAIVARRHFVTREAIAEMTKVRTKEKGRKQSGGIPDPGGTPPSEDRPDPLAAVRASVEARLRAFKKQAETT